MENWTTIRDRKQAERHALLPAKWLIPQDELPGSEVLDVMELCATRGWLDPSELDITGKTVTQLAAELKAGILSAVEVVSAFAHRATIAQQLLNAYVPFTDWRHWLIHPD
jgi:amidase